MSATSHRRDFVRGLALGGTAAITSPALANAHADDAPPARTEVDARMDLILARYGGFLDDDARKTIRNEVQSIVRRGEALRKFPLTNADEPSPVFSPYRDPSA